MCKIALFKGKVERKLLVEVNGSLLPAECLLWSPFILTSKASLRDTVSIRSWLHFSAALGVC